MKKLKVPEKELRKTLYILLNKALDKDCQLSRRERFQFRFICIAEGGGRVKRKRDLIKAYPLLETMITTVKKAIKEGKKSVAVQTRNKPTTRTLRVSSGAPL